MSFFNKLKNDMGIDETEEKDDEKSKKAKPKKKVKVEAEKKPESKLEPKPEPKKESKSLKIEPEELASQEEGQLAIDVYETNGDIIVQSTIGGIKAENLDVSIENDMITIRGSRENKVEKEGKKYFYQECFWGSFMRKVILPEEIDAAKAKAEIKDGVLTLTLPKIHRKIKRKITVQQGE